MAWIVLHLLMGHRYAAVWVSEVTLWRWAVLAAPFKDRPWVNYQKALASMPE